MPEDVTVFVLTGGPMAGKSTVKSRAAQEFGSLVDTRFNEAATAIFESGLPSPTGPEAAVLGQLLQGIIWRYQKYAEVSLLPEARRQGARVVLLDRGVLDGAAYLPGGQSELLQITGLTLEEIFSTVDTVIHLESVAMSRPEIFGAQGNASRYETVEQAIALEKRAQAAWQGHPDWRFIPSAGGIDDVTNRVFAIIREFLYREVERKWQLKQLPPGIDLGTPQQIEQVYLASISGFEQRFRKIDDHYLQTFKVGQGLSRLEDERPLSQSSSIGQAIYEASLPAAIGKINKLRYTLPDGGKSVLSIDIFQGPLTGHITVEREFPNERQATSYQLPSWLADAIEITDDPAYKNANLAQFGLP